MAAIKLLALWVGGWMAGALVNLLADQLPVSRRLYHPQCPHCGHSTGWLAYLFVEPCSSCGAKRGLRGFLVQWFFPLAFLTVGLWKSERMLTYEALVVLVYFGVILIIDLEHRLILHPVSLVGVALGILVGVRLHGPLATLYGGLAGFGLMLALYLLGEVFARVMARRRGEPIDEVALGFGDVNFSGVLGLLLGWPGITAGLLLAVLAGGIISGLAILVMVSRKRYQAFTALPYAPFLVFAGLALLLRP